MGLLEKVGIVEDVEDTEGNEEIDVSDVELDGELEMGDALGEELVDSDLPEGLEVNDLIQIKDVYEEYDLTNMDQSIFKVDDFKNSLPEDLPTDSKRQSVKGILQTSGLDLNDLLSDSNNRKEVLQSTLQQFTNETAEIVSENEEEIEELKNRIDELKEQNNNRKRLQEQQGEIIDEEVSRISGIEEFIVPDNDDIEEIE
jgi:gas vesicle protein